MDPASPLQQPDHTARPKSSSSNAASHSPALASVLPARTNSQSGSAHRASSRGSAHRQGFAENLRNPPPSPRSQRHPSFTQQAIQDLVNHPPANRQPNPRWVGRDWRGITLGELAGQDDIRWVGMETSVEEATMVCLGARVTDVVHQMLTAGILTDTVEECTQQCRAHPREHRLEDGRINLRSPRLEYIPLDCGWSGEAERRRCKAI
jgi:hypothetical protein